MLGVKKDLPGRKYRMYSMNDEVVFVGIKESDCRECGLVKSG